MDAGPEYSRAVNGPRGMALGDDDFVAAAGLNRTWMFRAAPRPNRGHAGGTGVGELEFERLHGIDSPKPLPKEWLERII